MRTLFQFPKTFHFHQIKSLAFLVALLFFVATFLTNAEPPKAVVVYFIDVEGGQATLFVTPAGESLLVDTGWDGFEGRRIASSRRQRTRASRNWTTF
nr:hypothetical protein [Candidatus Acidoferrum sp.]